MAFTRARSRRIRPHYTVVFARDSATVTPRGEMRMLEAAIAAASQRGSYGQCTAVCRFENSWRFPDDNPGNSPGNIRLARIRIRILGLSFEILFRIFGIVQILSSLHCLLTRTAASVSSNLPGKLSYINLRCNSAKKLKKKEKNFNETC